MSLPRFSYLAPDSLGEACALMTQYGDKARLMAGGTDLLLKMSQGSAAPEFVIGLRAIDGLNEISFDPAKGLRIGSLSRLADVAEHPDVRRHFPALAYSASRTATVQIRNMGTLAGNICNAAPSADNAAPLLVYGAEVLIVHPGGERVLPLTEFFRGPGVTALAAGEIVKQIRIPAPVARTGSDYQKLSARSKADIAAVGVAAMVVLDEAGVCLNARIALGAVAPVPTLAWRAGNIVAGQVVHHDLIEQAAATAAEECSPISDVRATAAYRRRMVQTLTARALHNSLNRVAENATGCES